jgi:site-specific recombinase XerD
MGDNVGITKSASTYTIRHLFVTHLIERGFDSRTLKELLGHCEIAITRSYTQVLYKRYYPLDQI